jgi:hypothetical protein
LVPIRPIRTSADHQRAPAEVDALMNARATLEGDKLDLPVTLAIA